MWIIIIFLLVVVLLLGVAFFGYFKDKKARITLIEENKQIEEVASVNHVSIYILLDLLIKDIDKTLDSFDHISSEKSISQINREASLWIKEIKYSKELKDLYQQTNRKQEIAPLIELLFKAKPQYWARDAHFAINVITAKTVHFRSDPANKAIVDKATALYNKRSI